AALDRQWEDRHTTVAGWSYRPEWRGQCAGPDAGSVVANQNRRRSPEDVMSDVLNRVGVEYLSVFGLPPVEFGNRMADLGCSYISTGLTAPPGFNPHGYRTFSLREDRALRREMVAAMRDRGVGISLGEGFLVRPNVDARTAYSGDLDIMAELGTLRINTTS